MNDNLVNEKNQKKKMVILIALIVTLVISTTGATYAYFALSASNNNVISGTSATADVSLEVTSILPTATNTGVMVPQISATSNTVQPLKTAVTGGCVDGNSNIACKVYKISFKNSSSATVRIKATMTLAGTAVSANSNFRWMAITDLTNQSSDPANPTYSWPTSKTVSTTVGAAKVHNTSFTTLVANETLAINKYHIWYIVVWVEETGNDQKAIDAGKSFTGTVAVDLIDTSGAKINGITSTFTS